MCRIFLHFALTQSKGDKSNYTLNYWAQFVKNRPHFAGTILFVKCY